MPNAVRIFRLTLLLAALAPRAARAQDSQPTSDESPTTPSQPVPASEPPQSEEPRRIRSLLDFDELTLDLGFDSRIDRRQTDLNLSREYPGRYRITDESRNFEETIGLRGEGVIADRRLADFRFDLRGGLEQDWFRESRPGRDLASRDDDPLLQYDARINLFPAGKVSASLFALNLDDRVARPFLPSLERRQERYGAEVLFNDAVLPMRLSYEDSYEELTSPSERRQDEERRGDRTFRYEATWRHTPQHELRLNYEYADEEERYAGNRDVFGVARNYLTLTDTLTFGADGRSRLDTIARFQDETGDIGQDVYEFAPRLRLHHSDRLATTYSAQVLEQQFQNYEIQQVRGEAGILHNWEDVLSSSLSAYGLGTDAERGSDVDEYGAIGNVSFAKDGDLGRFSTSLNYTHAWQRASDAGAAGVAINESQTFRDPLPATLAHSNVNRLSIVVLDARRTRVFLPGVDYVVIAAGRYTMLARVPTGRIVDGQTVLVSYTYDTAEGYELNRDRADLRIQHEFKNGFTPYYALSFQEEDIDRSRLLYFDPRRVNRHRVGLRYRQKRWGAGVEYEYNDDSVDPYQAGHANIDATLLERDAHSLAARGNYSFYHFEGAGRRLDQHEVSLLDLGMNYRYTFNPNLEAAAVAAYRYEDDTIAGITHGVDLSSSVNWRIGQFTALFEVEYDLLDIDRSSDGAVTVWIKLRREIPIVRRPE